MKVDKPRYDNAGDLIFCGECPFDENDDLCAKEPCPTAESYAEACALVETAEKEGR